MLEIHEKEGQIHFEEKEKKRKKGPQAVDHALRFSFIQIYFYPCYL